MRDFDAAIAAYNEVLRLNPQMRGVQLRLSELQLVRGNTETSRHLADMALQQAPASVAARIAQARLLIVDGDLKKADPLVAALLKDAPHVAAVHDSQRHVALGAQRTRGVAGRI